MDCNSVPRDIDGEYFAYAGSGVPLTSHRSRFNTAPTVYSTKTRTWRYCKTKTKGQRFAPGDNPRRHTNEVSPVYRLQDRNEQDLEMLVPNRKTRNHEVDIKVKDLVLKLPGGGETMVQMDKNYRLRNQRNLDLRDERLK